MKQNKNVAPLLLQKATQHKFNVIRTMLKKAPSVHQEKIKSKLDELVTDFKNETICIRTYNIGLDHVMDQLKKSLLNLFDICAAMLFLQIILLLLHEKHFLCLTKP